MKCHTNLYVSTYIYILIETFSYCLFPFSAVVLGIRNNKWNLTVRPATRQQVFVPPREEKNCETCVDVCTLWLIQSFICYYLCLKHTPVIVCVSFVVFIALRWVVRLVRAWGSSNIRHKLTFGGDCGISRCLS